MRIQIKKLSPHQNGKVFAILMAFSSLIFLIPMILTMSLSTPNLDQHGNPITFPVFMFIIMPILYLIFGYIFSVIGCFIYNFLFKYIGGFEYEFEEKNT